MLDREQMTSSNRQQWEVDFRRSSRGIHQNIGRDQYVVARDVQVLPDPDNPNLQMFYWTHGDDCGHKYLTRNVTMRPVCEKAARNKYTLMTQVREPEMCVYEMLVGTSLVCRDPRYPSSAAGTSGTALWTLQMRSTADGACVSCVCVCVFVYMYVCVESGDVCDVRNLIGVCLHLIYTSSHTHMYIQESCVRCTTQTNSQRRSFSARSLLLLPPLTARSQICKLSKQMYAGRVCVYACRIKNTHMCVFVCVCVSVKT
jgi:hypothetical protein